MAGPRSDLVFLAGHQVLRLCEDADGIRGGEQALADIEGEDVLELSIANGCSAYDGEFVLLAQDLGATLVTADPKLVSRFPATAVALSSFARG
jgi:hypothetical protein